MKYFEGLAGMRCFWPVQYAWVALAYHDNPRAAMTAFDAARGIVFQ